MNILLVSDTHLSKDTSAFAANWRAVSGHMETANYDLVVHLGDITVDGAGRRAELDEAAAHFRDLPAEIRFLPGNHDIGDNPPEPGAPVHSPVSAARLAAYRNVYGADYWSFASGPWQLIALNAQLLGTATDEEELQFAWLESTLGEASGPLGLLIHKPLFRNGREDREAHIRYVPVASRERLLDLLGRRDLRFVASGHAHQSHRVEASGVEHVWLPSASFCIPDAMQERIGAKEVGIARLTLDDQGHRFERVTPPGLERHNLLDYPELYPGLSEIRRKLGEGASL